MSIATKCTCGHSITGVCTSSVKECRQLKKEKIQLPDGLVNGIYMILLNHSHANRTIAAEEIAQYVVEEYATKLHLVEQENAELRRQNDKMKEMATGWRPLLEEALRRFSGISEAAGQPEDLNLINKIKKFLYGE